MSKIRGQAPPEGRVLVAHNARFDHAFLHAETRRNQRGLPVRHRLCTLTFSRRIGLPVENYRLQSLARYWGVQQTRWHDALDDVRVLSEIFVHTRALAARLGVDLPVLACDESDRARASPAPERAPRLPCLYVNPAPWQPGEPLVQGAKIVITGDTRRPRADWYDEFVRVGLNPMNSVSSQTRLVLSENPAWESAKLQAARRLGVPVVTEAQLAALLPDIRPGETADDVAMRRAAEKLARTARPRKPPVAVGPWSGRVVLVLGGEHAEAAQLRDRLARLGARVLVSLGATTTHVVALAGATKDKRWAKVQERGLAVVDADLELADPSAPVASPAEVAVLVRGEVADLPASDVVSMRASWTPGFERPVVDVVAFALGADERVATDDDFVFYNRPHAIGLSLNVDGDAEQGIDLDLDQLAPHVDRVRIAAVIDGAGTFGDLGPIALSVATDEEDFATAVLDAASVETALVVAEAYRRRGRWRIRVVGRGYEMSLADLAISLGVDVDG